MFLQVTKTCFSSQLKTVCAQKWVIKNAVWLGRPKIWNMFYKLSRFQTIWCRRKWARGVKRLGIFCVLTFKSDLLATERNSRCDSFAYIINHQPLSSNSQRSKNLDGSSQTKFLLISNTALVKLFSISRAELSSVLNETNETGAKTNSKWHKLCLWTNVKNLCSLGIATQTSLIL